MMLQIQQQRLIMGIKEWIAEKIPTINPPRSAGLSLLFIGSSSEIQAGESRTN
jgi:hypothetical protein